MKVSPTLLNKPEGYRFFSPIVGRKGRRPPQLESFGVSVMWATGSSSLFSLGRRKINMNMKNNEKPNRKILLGLFDVKTQTPEEITKIMTERIREIGNMPKSSKGNLSQSQEELQKLCKPAIDQIREKYSINKNKKVKIEIDDDRKIHINFVSEPEEYYQQKIAKKKNNIFVAIGKWVWSVITWWVGWLTLIAFMFLPPLLVVLIVWILTGIEPNVYAILASIILIIFYWFSLFKTKTGNKCFNFFEKIARIHY